MKAFLLSSSPRREGNSALLLREVAAGLEEAGHYAVFVYADDILGAFLRDCRRCRGADGECTIGDGFRPAFLEQYLPAEGFVAATPIYWYGMSGQLKTFFDRMFCEYAASSPRSADVVRGIGNARGEVARDPMRPLACARQFGRDFFTRHSNDYQIDTPRSGRVWGA